MVKNLTFMLGNMSWTWRKQKQDLQVSVNILDLRNEIGHERYFLNKESLFT